MNNSTSSEVKRSSSQQLGRRNQPYLMTRWKYLWLGEFVEMRRGDREVGTGWVDDLTPDGILIWIHRTEGRGRKMIHRDDGVDIWRVDSRVLQGRQVSPPGQSSVKVPLEA